MTPSWEQSELADLRWHWDTAYHIAMLTSEAGDWWMAVGRETGHRLGAETAEELRALIREDYAARGEARLRP